MSDLPLLDERTCVACKLPRLWPFNKRGVIFLRFNTPSKTNDARVFFNALAGGLWKYGADTYPSARSDS